MYIQITTRCNMKCRHCCFSCTNKGIDMEWGTYQKALQLASEHGAYIAIGGGEPTVHPKFWDYIDMALDDEFIEGVWLATNGKRKKDALKIVEYMREYADYKFSAELSQDEYHDPVCSEVVEAFERVGDSRTRPTRGAIRNVSGRIVKQGRAEKNEIWSETGCACDTLFIDPEGCIWNCGCKQVQFGTIWDSQIPSNYQEIAGYDGGHDYAIKDAYMEEHGLSEYEGMY